MYMGFDRGCGPGEGAILIFAKDAKAARVMAWHELKGWSYDHEWTDAAARRLRDCEHLRAAAESDGAHVVDNPPTCEGCERWGGKINGDGICSECLADWPEKI